MRLRQSKSAALALLGLMLQLGGTAPPGEQDASDFTIPTAGVTGMNLSAGSGRLSDAVVALYGGGGAPVPSICAWTRTGAGASGWEWSGVIDAPGLPPAGGLSSGARLLLTNGTDTVAFTRAPGMACVLRRVNGQWEYRGKITYTGGSNAPCPVRAIDGDTAILTGTSYRVLQRHDDGAWVEASTFTGAQLGVLYGNNLVLRNGLLLLGGKSTTSPGTQGARLAVAEVLPDGIVQPRGVSAPPTALAWRFADQIATDGEWTAVPCRTLADSRIGLAFYKRQADGSLGLTQLEPDAGGYPSDLRNGRLAATNAVWSLDAASIWHRGAELTPQPNYGATLSAYGLWSIVSGDDVARLSATTGSAVTTLRVWKRPFDCDGNGTDDALEIATDPSLDCNLNGRKDACDIAEGTLLDANGNGIPDLCEADCDSDLVPDVTQIRSGAPAACDSPNSLASCAIASGAADGNGDGIVDACGPDLNGNGIPDYLEVAGASATDCNGDGIPDDVHAYNMDGIYGGPGTETTWTSSGSLMLSQSFVTDPAHRTITGASFALGRSTGCSAVGRRISLLIARDPTEDGNPSDAEVVAYVSGIAIDADWQALAIEPVEIDTALFFAAYTIERDPDLPCFDIDNDTSCGQITSLAHSTCGRITLNSFSGPLPPDPQVILRGCVDGLEYGFGAVPMGVFSLQCTAPADFNHDGTVDGADLGALLGAWGPAAGSPCDLNRDASVDGADLGLLLGAWGTTAP